MKRKGFTLIELLVVVAIISVLIGLLLPAVQMARAAARRTACLSNMHQTALALHLHDDSKGRLPGYLDTQRLQDGTGAPVTWVVKILPYLERGDAYDLITEQGAAAAASVPALPVMKCPSSSAINKDQVDYAANGGSHLDKIRSTATGALTLRQAIGDGVFHDAVGGTGDSGSVHIPASMSLERVSNGDGTSTTLMLAERCGSHVALRPSYVNTFDPSWVRPTHGTSRFRAGPLSHLSPITIGIQWDIEQGTPINETFNTAEGYKFPSGLHGGNFSMAMVDGSVRTLSMQVEESVYAQLLTSDRRTTSRGGNPNMVNNWNLPLMSEEMMVTE